MECNKCKCTKDLTDFYVRTTGALIQPCKCCQRAITRKYRANNKEKADKASKLWKDKNKQKHLEWRRTRGKRPDIRRKTNEHNKRKYHKDPKYRAMRIIGASIRKIAKAFGFRKAENTGKILGCTSEQLITHLGITSIADLTGMHIDHICPQSCAETEDEVYKLNHHTNLRIITAEENLRKSDAWTPEGAALHLKLLGREWPQPLPLAS